ncbi:CRISPR-associated helicase Cas3' [Labrys monachus]|uniref:CRISPR-associated endonuclease/helicase Cas3 n=1 Tax=Labrys monachus TaxID=217067 RepID=A0ABU0FMN9_9HYPH|nr:CRISPR-associated helicase Cas3' [Labrys monachus]MDQ0395878.1 CRISPR-associated endonuclease/helicase Cas3 [Labrys monachus]
MYYAHSSEDQDRARWQPLAEHLRAVAELGAVRGGKFGAGKACAVAGWLHDLGKYTKEFQAYIAGQRRDGGDHSTAGAQEVLRLASARSDRLIAELVAYAIAGHHAGLPDRSGETGSLDDRLVKALPQLDAVWRDEVEADAAGLFPPAFEPHPDGSRHAFQFAFLGRMIFSTLVDADFLDTEAYYAGLEGRPVDRDWPLLPGHVDRLVGLLDAHMAAKTKAAPDTPLNRLRGEILGHVRAGAALAPGVFTLDVPTGGGKTLASLAFALDHARRWGMERIVYAIPFTSIIDQTATIFRDALGEDVVLEHHSAIEEEKPSNAEGRDKLRLAMENWDAPVVVTTNVQLFESLFANRSSRCRKLHNLARAVIVLDEAQTIPLPVLRPCVAALDELARNYGCTIVLCTATQPALASPRFKGGFEIGTDRELAPRPVDLHAALKRVTLELRGTMTDDDLVEELAGHPQGLVVVNGRKHALDLYRKAEAVGLEGVIHLTTRQTAADRRRILQDVRQRLRDGRPCRLVATSLIEAGVDIDFPRAWRAETGLDQIMQAAGRVNREGRRPAEESLVVVFRPAEALPPTEIRGFAAAMQRVVAKGHRDLASQAAITDYFREVYWQRGGDLDRHGVATAFVVDPRGMTTNFAYRTVAAKFRLVESGMEAVIVAIEEEAGATLRALAAGLPPAAAARRLQNFVVQVPPRLRQKLIDNGHVAFVEGFGDQFAVLKSEGLYSRDVGLLFEDADELGFDGII